RGGRGRPPLRLRSRERWMERPQRVLLRRRSARLLARGARAAGRLRLDQRHPRLDDPSPVRGHEAERDRTGAGSRRARRIPRAQDGLPRDERRAPRAASLRASLIEMAPPLVLVTEPFDPEAMERLATAAD